MDKNLVEKISSMPQYQELVTKRSHLAWKLTAVMFAAYYGFILLIAFKPDFFKTVVYGDVLTIGFPIGVGLIILAFALTGYYVRRANTEFDQLTQQIKDEVNA